MNQDKRILIVSSEVKPYLPNSAVSDLTSICCKFASESGYQVRVFTPKYGLINERKHRLHEVVRLSGTQLSINDFKVPLIIKVATIPDQKLQAYFVDNEEYFRRRFLYTDSSKKLFEDNDERAIFFAKGVIDTVKSLGWIPDVIHIHGHLSLLIPLYLKEFYANDIDLSNIKLVTILSEDILSSDIFDNPFVKKVSMDIKEVKLKDFTNSMGALKSALTYSDHVLIEQNLENLSSSLTKDHNYTLFSTESLKETLLGIYP